MSERIEEIKKRVMHKDATSLNIRRIRKSDVAVFKDIANQEFLLDYGMLFKTMLEEWLLFRKLKSKYIESDDYEIILVNKGKVQHGK